MFGGGFNATKLKPQLKMACGRIQIASNKKTALLKQSTREVAAMLAEDPPKEEKARIRAEALIRDDHLIEAYEILILECELLHERIKLITYSKSCPHDLVGVISTLIWASHRVDIPELLLIRKQFVAKYGKVFEENAMRNEHGVLNDRVVSKLSIEPPPAYLVQSYLEKIAEQYDVDWTPSYRLTANDMIEPMAPPTGYSVLPSSTGTGFGLNTIQTASTPMNNGNGVNIPFAPNDANGGNMMIPPPAPTTTTTYTNQSRTTNDGMNNSTSKTIYDEPDIFVPGKPSAPEPSPTSFVATSSLMKEEDDAPKNNYDDDDENGNNTNNDNGSNDLGDSYSNLAARFSQLKK